MNKICCMLLTMSLLSLIFPLDGMINQEMLREARKLTQADYVLEQVRAVLEAADGVQAGSAGSSSPVAAVLAAHEYVSQGQQDEVEGDVEDDDSRVDAPKSVSSGATAWIALECFPHAAHALSQQTAAVQSVPLEVVQESCIVNVSEKADDTPEQEPEQECEQECEQGQALEHVRELFEQQLAERKRQMRDIFIAREENCSMRILGTELSTEDRELIGTPLRRLKIGTIVAYRVAPNAEQPTEKFIYAAVKELCYGGKGLEYGLITSSATKKFRKIVYVPAKDVYQIGRRFLRKFRRRN